MVARIWGAVFGTMEPRTMKNRRQADGRLRTIKAGSSQLIYGGVDLLSSVQNWPMHGACRKRSAPSGTNLSKRRASLSVKDFGCRPLRDGSDAAVGRRSKVS